jgi:hypothetical protein
MGFLSNLSEQLVHRWAYVGQILLIYALTLAVYYGTNIHLSLVIE